MKAAEIKRYIIAAAMLVAVIISLMIGGVGKTYAATAAYSEVLEDLNADSDFNAAKYPYNAKDYRLEVIQVAESTAGELLIYVYQPSGQTKNFRATSINIARIANNTTELSFKNYPLEFQAASGTIFKYRVQSFELEKTAIRYYNISNILRPFDKMIDKPPADGGSISETKNRVGQLWTACTVGDTVTYSMTESEVIEIENKYVGFFNYFDGMDIKAGWDILLGKLNMNATHTIRNFVAFSTDRKIDKLREVEIQYCLQDYSFKVCANPYCLKHKLYEQYDKQSGAIVQQDPVTIHADETITNNQHGINGNTYEWKSIQTTAEFLEGADSKEYKLTEEGKDGIEKTQWVLNFYDSVVEMNGKVHPTENHMSVDGGKTVSDVIILRLLFEENGQTYNIGAVDNKQTSSGKPINVHKPAEGLSPLAKALIIGGVIILAVVVVVVLALLFPAFGKVVLAILNALWWIISAPVRLVVVIVQSIQKRKETAATEETEENVKTEAAPKKGKSQKKKRTAGNGGKKTKRTAVNPATEKKRSGTKHTGTKSGGAGKRGGKK